MRKTDRKRCDKTMRWQHIVLLIFIFFAGCSRADKVAGLIQELEDNNNWDIVRGRAAYALGKHKDPRAVVPLIAALQDHDEGVRWAAVVALGKIRDRRATEPLFVALKDKDRDVRCAGVVALGKMKDVRAVEALIATLRNDKNEVCRSLAARSLSVGSKIQEQRRRWFLHLMMRVLKFE